MSLSHLLDHFHRMMLYLIPLLPSLASMETNVSIQTAIPYTLLSVSFATKVKIVLISHAKRIILIHELKFARTKANALILIANISTLTIGVHAPMAICALSMHVPRFILLSELNFVPLV
jgi:hypothetical protein